MLTGSPMFRSQAALAARDRQIVALLELSHPSLLEPMRAVSDTVSLVSGGKSYEAFPFIFEFPGEGDTIPEARITIQNVDKRIVEGIRAIKGPMSAVLAAVLRDEPDTLITDYPGLLLVNVQATSAYVTGTLAGRLITNSAWPGRRATPERTPGLHYT